MKMQIFLYALLFFFFLRFGAPFSSLAQHLCRPHDSLALLQFKETFHISHDAFSFPCDVNGQPSYPKISSWNKSRDCCVWDGITCHELTGHVIGLDLSCSQLEGAISPNSSLFALSRLEKLNLARNNFMRSQISRGFGGFTTLTHLNLSNSNFSGQIASEISHLSKLILLDLSRDVYFPSNGGHRIRFGQHEFQLLLQNLTRMGVLSLKGVDISSEVPMNLSSSLSYLDLSNTGVHGKLPNDVFQLPNLQTLRLYGNLDLTGSLPEFNCSKSPLQELDLSEANFCGELPNSIGCLKSLEVLYLGYNHFNGPLPESIGNLSKLNSLYLGFNNFIGPPPKSIGNLSKLNYLDLSFNHFIGPPPKSIGNLSKLNYLDLSFNHFIGALPESIGNLSELNYLYLCSNNFIGHLPKSIEKLSKLNYLYLRNNQLYGQIPNSVSKLLNLVSLDLSSNNLSGIVEPNTLSNLKKLERLDLSDNIMLIWRIDTNVTLSFPNLEYLGLSSCGLKEVPEFLRNSKDLHFLQLSNNNIRQIPTWFASMPWDSLQYLNLSHNSLSTLLPLHFKNLATLDIRSNKLRGPLPVSLCNLELLQVLDISSNKLTGAIPQCFGNFSRELLVLDLKNNSLQGKIALTFAENFPLTTLGLNGNLLEGPLPRSLSNCGQLEVLDVGNNNISDTFPTWMENFKELQVLILKSNRFFGSIGTLKTKNPFEKLRVIDISSNKFIGVLPTSLLKSFRAMESMNQNESKARYMETRIDFGYYQASVQLAMKGQEIEFTKILTILTSIDVSSNRFSGEIPNIIGNLVSLKILNLSHNGFSGHIPSILGNLSSLESLDISCNHVEGEIPSQLTLLTYLSFLNLSQNHLKGRIPQGPQFNTFSNDSYIGNLRLCGPPLTKNCGKTEAPPPFPQLFYQENDDSDFFSGFTWKSVIMGYGCGIVFGMAIGSLMFFTGKPESIVGFIEKEMYHYALLFLSKKQVHKRFKMPTRRRHKLKHQWGAHRQSNPHE